MGLLRQRIKQRVREQNRLNPKPLPKWMHRRQTPWWRDGVTLRGTVCCRCKVDLPEEKRGYGFGAWYCDPCRDVRSREKVRRYKEKQRAAWVKRYRSATCKNCGDRFPAYGKKQYCTEACRLEARRIRDRERRKGVSVSSEQAYGWSRNNLKVTNNELGMLIDRVMERERTTQHRLAKLMGVDHSALSRIRTGQRGTSFVTVSAMAETWPLTEDEKVELFTMFHYIPPGYHIEKD